MERHAQFGVRAPIWRAPNFATLRFLDASPLDYQALTWPCVGGHRIAPFCARPCHSWIKRTAVLNQIVCAPVCAISLHDP